MAMAIENFLVAKKDSPLYNLEMEHLDAKDERGMHMRIYFNVPKLNPVMTKRTISCFICTMDPLDKMKNDVPLAGIPDLNGRTSFVSPTPTYSTIVEADPKELIRSVFDTDISFI